MHFRQLLRVLNAFKCHRANLLPGRCQGHYSFGQFLIPGQFLCSGANTNMFTRFNLKDSALFKFVAKLFRGKRKRKSTSESPWLEGLDSRLASYDTNLMQPTTYNSSEAAAEAEEQLRQLCSGVQQELEDTDRVVIRKERRQVDSTAVDIKAWWGGAVATWDPIDIKNLDSINQTRRPRKSKWFDNQPGSDLGRPS